MCKCTCAGTYAKPTYCALWVNYGISYYCHRGACLRAINFKKSECEIYRMILIFFALLPARGGTIWTDDCKTMHSCTRDAIKKNYQVDLYNILII